MATTVLNHRFFTKSKPWLVNFDHSKTGILHKSVTNLLGDITDDSAVAILGINYDSIPQALFKPVHSTEDEDYLVGNLSNDYKMVCYGYAPLKALTFAYTLDSFDNIHRTESGDGHC